VNSKKIYILAINFYPLLAKKAPNIPFCYLLLIYPKMGLGALLKNEREREKERERERKVKRKRTNVPIKKTLPLSIPSSLQSFFKSSKKRGMESFSREQ
jgi:hypothetical protein